MPTPPRAKNSEATKSSILLAAREHFANRGYEKATVRGIAADAGIDPALVIRYFGAKEALFAAAADFDLKLPDLSSMPRSKLGAALATHLLDRWEDDDNLKALLRAAVTNPAAAERCQQVFAHQLAESVRRLDNDPATAATRAALVASQALGMALTRYILRLPPMVAMDKGELIRRLAPTFQRYLTG